MSIETASPNIWKKCSSCKKSIGFKELYWVCNVSTCNRKRTGLSFCSVSCWDAHVPMMNHRESWAEERKAPTQEQWAKTLAGEDEEPRAPRTKSVEAKPEAPVINNAPKVILRRKASE